MSEPEVTDRFGRISDIVDVAALQRKRVTLIGMGSMGNPVADQLVRHGVGTVAPGRLRLIDGDTVESRNLIGTGYRLCHVGQPKVEATASMLREVNEDVNVSYWQPAIEECDIDRVFDMAKQSDLIGLFADSFGLMVQIADQCHALCPVVTAIFGPQVDYAEVAFSIPGQTPQLSTVMGRRSRTHIDKPQAFGCDTTYVTSFVTALCLHLLIGNHKGQEFFACYANAPLFLVGLRRTWLFTKQRADVVRSIFCVGAPHMSTSRKELHV